MESPPIPDSFLSGTPPPATLRLLDFQTTTPPIPAFKDHFAAIIDNFMTPVECAEFLRLAAASTPTPHAPWDRALINAGGGRQILAVDARKSSRILWDSPDVAQRLLDRLRPHLHACGVDRVVGRPGVTGLGPARRGEALVLTRVNERLRVLRYDGGDYFRPHWDGCYVTPDGREQSLFTMHLYLNGDGEQDAEELGAAMERAEKLNDENEMKKIDDKEKEEETLLGGATSFADTFHATETVRVFPKTGSVLVFQQRNLLHGGDDVFRGVKFTVRSDLMYMLEK
ncbi:hypothetical protein N7462_006289 [Penicillium macrosclerotiorum]|uniref:uncharacterized protein n=1 Tax=Penicillium macrosclerotiorum TaxID=303699 RepID=UPI00254985E9|nr:uncharacterized protein N7462_006289 [Penicillium macrosclerotiorum]KAJ5683124.1 hypothetical protein N7462_006289 [Penicillium macrosclerotiorum]